MYDLYILLFETARDSSFTQKDKKVGVQKQSSFLKFNSLCYCAEYSPQQHDCWPLDSEIKSVILKNYSNIADLLDVNEDLVSEMLSRQCFGLNQLVNIENTSDGCERSKKLLNFLLKGSASTLKLFAECLHSTQRHLVPLITGNTGTF